MASSSLQQSIINPIQCSCQDALWCICNIDMPFGIPIGTDISPQNESLINFDLLVPLFDTSEDTYDDTKRKQYLDDLVCNLNGDETEEECSRRFYEYQRINHCRHQSASQTRKHERDRIKQGLPPRNTKCLDSKTRTPRRKFHSRIKMSKAYLSRKSTERTRKSRYLKKKQSVLSNI
jgi:hypothetical protein